MKNLLKYLPLLSILVLFPACSSDSENDPDPGIPPRELILSVEPDVYGIVETDEMDFEFQILNGNGGYSAKVSERGGDPDAKVTIDGNNVTVNLLVAYGTEITIVDAKGEESSFILESTNEALKNLHGGYGITMDVGGESFLFDKLFPSFGAGAPYTIERVRGAASEVKMVDDNPQFKVLKDGVTNYKLKDKRGSVLPVTIASRTKEYELSETTKSIEIEAENNNYVSVKIKWGDEWKIVKSEQTIVDYSSVDRPYVIDRENGNHRADFYSVFITTTDTGSGTDIINLVDKDGKTASIKVTVK